MRAGKTRPTTASPSKTTRKTIRWYCVNWDDAKAFCAWLSKKEGKTYRLPTDHEWSIAVGIGDQEDEKATPEEKSGKIPGVFPWGEDWPPPKGAGNYSDESRKEKAPRGDATYSKATTTASPPPRR